MRSVLSISLPAEVKKEIEKRAKIANKSTSAYILEAVKLEKSMISEDELLEMSNKAKSDYAKGKIQKLSALSDLM